MANSGFLACAGKGHGADLYLHQHALETTTPSVRALFGMMAVFAEFERAMIQERVHAGLSRAKAQGKKLGRPSLSGDIEAKVRALRAEGVGVVKVAKTLGIGVSCRAANSRHVFNFSLSGVSAFLGEGQLKPSHLSSGSLP